MTIHNLMTLISFSLAIAFFSSIVLSDYESKTLNNKWLRLAVYFITFIPIFIIPFSIRIVYFFLGVFFLTKVTYRISVYQTFWFTTLYMLQAILLELFILIAFDKVLTQFNFDIQSIISQSIMLILVCVAALYIKKPYVKFIEQSHIVKNYQITYPVVIVSFMFFFSIYISLILVDIVNFRVKLVSSVLFITLFIILAFAIILFADRNLKTKNELEKMKHRMLKFKGDQENAALNDAFTESIEFDLFNSNTGGKISEHFRLHRLLYRSTNSNIYLLKDLAEEQQFTLKVIEKRDGILYDFESLKDIQHPSIVPILLTAEGEKYHYVVKPYVNGLDLRHYVEKQGPLDSEKLKKIGLQIITILDALHSRKEPVIYRDLKPSNIIYNEAEGRIHLIDLESIRKFCANKSSDTFIIGSRGYTPPEQYGFSQTLPQSDIYAFGATLYYLLTGNEPDYRTISTHTHASNQPNAYFDIIKKCMAFNPDDRYGSIGELTALFE